MFNPVAIIEKKKSGGRLTAEEIAWIVGEYISGTVRDYQMAALLMAIYFQGMDAGETADLTACMLDSGKRLDLSSAGPPRVDKHSTGGVGDKVSIALAPLAAELGLKVPMLSGRSLGHTGGTLDKLESIPGFTSLLSVQEMVHMIEEVGCFISGPTAEIAPADRKLYALRDVTGTIDCVPLITSSILSKKLAEGIDALVMDVKYGSGAFMQTLAGARSLARSLVKTGARLGLEVKVVITSMDEPLGFAAGNALEVIEAVNLLKAAKPADLVEVTTMLAAEMVRSAGLAAKKSEALAMVNQAISSGAALARLAKWVRAQGGELCFERDDLGLELAPHLQPVSSEVGGFIQRIDARVIGLAVIDLGGGRKTVEEGIDHGVGVVLKKKIGDRVNGGEPVALLYARDERTALLAGERVRSAIKIGRASARIKPELIKETW